MIYNTSRKIETLIVLFLFITAFCTTYTVSNLIPHEVVTQGQNVWFQADTTRVFENMTDRLSNHYRTNVHPLFSIATGPIIFIMTKIMGLDDKTAVAIFNSLITSMWLVLIYFILRLLKLNKADASLFTLMTFACSSTLFWIAIPETFLLGSLTILIVTASAFLKSNNPYIYSFVNAISLVATVTNWMAGLILTFLNFNLKTFTRITFDALIIVTIMSAIQHVLFPSSSFFMFIMGESRYVFMEEAGTFIDKLRVFFFHSIIMPEFLVSDYPQSPIGIKLSIQLSKLATLMSLPGILIITWSTLFSIGIYSLFKWNENVKVKHYLLLLIIGQSGLHLFYGDETFLYSLHWLPLLIFIAALGTKGRLKNFVRCLSVLFVVGLSFNNINQLISATNIVNSNIVKNNVKSSQTERQRYIQTKKLFPQADWPKETGHVILSLPGSKLVEKGYHEPGGSFSPGFGSFGISIALFDDAGKLVTSSNSIKEERFTQQIDHTNNALITLSSTYHAQWMTKSDGSYTLNVSKKEKTNSRLAIRVTSAGPSGNAIKSISMDNGNLIVNDKHKLKFSNPVEAILFDDERVQPDLNNMKKDFQAFNEDGYIGMTVLIGSESVSLNVSCITCKPNKYLITTQQKVKVKVKSNEPSFDESIQAQIFHLKGSIVDNQTRPGDPGNYPLNWLRDGAFIVAALARSGELELSRNLIEEFAQKDFFGGFGSEADAPGLSIWAIYEVAIRSDENYQREIWPDIERKANLILEMLYSKNNLVKEFLGPVVPTIRDKKYSYLTGFTTPSKNGLITGKMDNHYPIFYVNAVSYLGLKKAAIMALTLGYEKNHKLYENEASKLKVSWEEQLATHPDNKNQRTRISGIYPSNIVSNSTHTYQALLEDNWNAWFANDDRQSKWTYFDVAEAHQWLHLGEEKKVWSVLNWFWNHQSSKGLYTWWEGDKEENSFELWPNVRGWSNPDNVTPHYWTAAEMLLLQLNMLVYESGELESPTITLGLGLSVDMLQSKVEVSGINTIHGKISWLWDGSVMFIDYDGTDKPIFILGPNFPSNAEIIYQ